MMEKMPLFSLPYPSTATIREPTVAERGSVLFVALVCDDDGHARPVCLAFTKPRAFRKRQEIYCTEWHIKEAYDTVCEVRASNWVAELRNDAAVEWRDYWTMRHFMIYLDSFGCLEVVAESAALEDVMPTNSFGT